MRCLGAEHVGKQPAGDQLDRALKLSQDSTLRRRGRVSTPGVGTLDPNYTVAVFSWLQDCCVWATMTGLGTRPTSRRKKDEYNVVAHNLISRFMIDSRTSRSSRQGGHSRADGIVQEAEIYGEAVLEFTDEAPSGSVQKYDIEPTAKRLRSRSSRSRKDSRSARSVCPEGTKVFPPVSVSGR